MASVTASLVVSGCSAPPWEAANAAEVPMASAAAVVPSMSEEQTPAKVPEPQPSTEPSEEPSAPPMVVDDLADGAVRHQFTAGGLVVTADYWTTRDKRDWTAASVKPVTLNLSAEGADEVSLTAIQVQVERLTDAGWVAVPAVSITQPVLAGAPVVVSPSTASAAVLVNAVEADSHALRYTLVYTLTVAGREGPVQSVADDTLVVALAH